MNDMNDKDRAAVARYYALVADGYDAIEEDEERTEDLDEVADGVAGLVEGMTVLELACGTGRWTEILADVAGHVIAVDINAAMLDQARARGLDEDLVTFVQADALDLPADLVPEGVAPVKAVFIGFWWSHLTRAHQEGLLAALRARLGKDVLLVVLDDNDIEGVRLPVARTDAQGNTWQMVTTPDGERMELPKNYPTDSTLKKRLGNVAREVRVARWDTVWVLTCRLK
ncbi:class I SAM-dependent methyltransferase [uncultured Massilia sp.]|uniref:class I SAM-dependent methyltransferase n=1 Tax=uncultured Massilia sp. TaxID=169973 RepID=UPI0025F06CCF|nr:class I SAM-dependent methyltransferase [uncultured Massilia sp.]